MYKVLYKERQRRNTALNRYYRMKKRLNAGRFDAGLFDALASERSQIALTARRRHQAAAAATADGRSCKDQDSMPTAAGSSLSMAQRCASAQQGHRDQPGQRTSSTTSLSPSIDASLSPEASNFNLVKALWRLVTFQPVMVAAQDQPAGRRPRHLLPTDTLDAAAAAAAADRDGGADGLSSDGEQEQQQACTEEPARSVLQRTLTQKRESGRLMHWLVFYSILLQHDEEVAMLLAQRVDKVCYGVVFILFNLLGVLVFALPHMQAAA